MKIICGIYKITSPSGRVYIGQAVDIYDRWKDYKSLSCKNQRRLYNSLLKYSFESHIFEILEECLFEDLNCRERYYQDFYEVTSKKGMNCLLVNTKDKKKILSEEVIKRISNTKIKNEDSKGTKNPNFGKKWSEEEKQRNRMQAIESGRSKGTSNPCFGKYGEDHPAYGRTGLLNSKSKVVLDTQTGVFYYSLKEAAEAMTMNRTTLGKQLNGKYSNKTNLIYC